MNPPVNRAASSPVDGSITILFASLDAPGVGHLYDVVHDAAEVLAAAGITGPYAVAVTVHGERPPAAGAGT